MEFVLALIGFTVKYMAMATAAVLGVGLGRALWKRKKGRDQ